ncbi:MAG: glycosyltransferase family 4 protein [Anaerolineae bacterium]|nr:glycosyltransferase family 4 protein [Anaerolineae bacterium]
MTATKPSSSGRPVGLAPGGSEECAPLRVLMVAPTSFFGHYGGHIRILEETRALQSLGHDVRIVTYNKGEDVAGVPIIRTRRLPWHADYEVGSSRHKLAFDAYLLASVLRFGLRWRPDIVHGHMHEGALIGGILARLLRVPLVFDFQGSLTGEMLDHGFIGNGGMAYRVWRRLERFICHLPDVVLTSSIQARALLNEEFGVNGERIKPLPDCADLEHFNPRVASANDHAALRRKFGIPPDRPVVVYLGLLAEYQGTDQILEAAVRLKAQGEDVHFLVMGYPRVEHYQVLAQRLNVADRVTFTGRVDYCRDAPRYLSLGQVAVSPKLSATEGSGKVLNYMALAKPVVAYDTPVHREYLGEAGVYAPAEDVAAFAEAIRALLHDPERRAALGAALRERARNHYSWEVAGKEIDGIYRSRACDKQNSVRIREVI